ncbi:hypothetical protein [sulfur-oxidizing endosymbiont of Gigantopelta aegis]|uniref:hypothetical protein n=1 Tax=sulfur-oxidizing endosymbiont of Gigantopelta aegis TaxID=2794934 RepID=UPI0018DB57DF|nr:hypothetical protein [sulfur-oxidizing endosymbiont of Gigantopelta aegis]
MIAHWLLFSHIGNTRNQINLIDCDARYHETVLSKSRRLELIQVVSELISKLKPLEWLTLIALLVGNSVLTCFDELT